MADNRSSDNKYYSSGNKSAINNGSPVNRRGRLGDPITTANIQAPSHDDRNSDKYYRNAKTPAGQPQRKTVPQHNAKKLPTVNPGEAYASSAANDPASQGAVRPLIVRDRTAVRDVVSQIVALLLGGQIRVLVQVASDSLEADVRLGLDLRTAREEITRDQYRDVVFSLIPKDNAEVAEQMVGKLDPAAVPVRAEESALPDDFAAFVKGGGDLDADATIAAAMDAPTDPKLAAAAGELAQDMKDRLAGTNKEHDITADDDDSDA